MIKFISSTLYHDVKEISPEIHFTIKLCEIFKYVPHVKISPKIDLIIRPDQEKNLSLIFFFFWLIYNIVITA